MQGEKKNHICFWLPEKLSEGYIEECKMIFLWWNLVMEIDGDGDCGGGYGYFHGEAWQVVKKEMWDRIRGDSRANNEVFFSC